MRLLLPILLTALVLSQAGCRISRSTAQDEQPAEPPTEHGEVEVEGWTLVVDTRLLPEGEFEELGARALELLEAQLRLVATVVPEEPLERLRAVPIRVDHEHPLGPMQYHPSSAWLRGKGYDPTLAKCVHIPQVDRFVQLAATNHQPWVVLHELAHAFHDREHGFDEPRIRAAHARVRESGIYDRVLHIAGHETDHYALTDPMEFFAEMTEAYFGTNDFYPFVRAELRRHDLETYALLEQIWGPVP